MYSHILLTTDGSELADRAVADGVALASALKAKVTILCVIQPVHAVAPSVVMVALPAAEYQKGAEEYADAALRRAEAAANEKGVKCDKERMVSEQPWQAIIDVAGLKGCDLIVMGSHGRSGITQMVLGSQTQKVLSHSSLPVLVTR